MAISEKGLKEAPRPGRLAVQVGAACQQVGAACQVAHRAAPEARHRGQEAIQSLPSQCVADHLGADSMKRCGRRFKTSSESIMKNYDGVARVAHPRPAVAMGHRPTMRAAPVQGVAGIQVMKWNAADPAPLQGPALAAAEADRLGCKTASDPPNVLVAQDSDVALNMMTTTMMTMTTMTTMMTMTSNALDEADANVPQTAIS